MTDDELDAIEQRYAACESRHQDIPALVAEVRRLRREILAAGTMQEFDWSVLERLDRLEEAESEVKRLQDACAKTEDEVEQILGKALGYPWYKDDPGIFSGATEADGVCVGEHVAASLAMEAVGEIERLRAALQPFAQYGAWTNFRPAESGRVGANGAAGKRSLLPKRRCRPG